MASSTSSSASSAASSAAAQSPSSAAAHAAFASFRDPREITKVVWVPALKVNLPHMKTLHQQIKPFLASLPRVRNIVHDGCDAKTQRLVLLNPETQREDLPGPVQALLDSGEIHLLTHRITLDYNSLPTGELMSLILPGDVEPCTSFETVGHIAHMNLKEHHLPYKHLIGEIILLKNPQIKTVVNKLGNINAVFRTFDMEVIAGKDELEAEVSENGCRFRMHYPDVYWNSRLGTEHCRKVSALKKDDIVCDMFAGIGPFAIPAAKAGVQVFANDLNPKSTEWMAVNKKLNKISHNLTITTMDGREFVRDLVKRGQRFTQVFMNLPASAEMFLDAFIHLFPRSFGPLPTIHCYGFAPPPDPLADFKRRVEEVLTCPLPQDAHIYQVRNVSPQKDMVCAVFRLPEEIAYAEGVAHTARHAPGEAAVGDKRSSAAIAQESESNKRPANGQSTD